MLAFVIILTVMLHFARGDVAQLSQDLEAFRTSIEKSNAETQTLVTSVPGVAKKKGKRARKATREVQVEIAAKERDTSGRTMIGAPPNQ